MAWNGGQSSQYCRFCKHPISDSINNRKVICIECNEPGCCQCTDIYFENKRPTCHYVHRDRCSLSEEVKQTSLTEFCRLVDDLIEGSFVSSTKNCDKLVNIIRCRNPELFCVDRGNGQTKHFDIYFDNEPRDFCLQLINPSGYFGGLYRIPAHSTELKRVLSPGEVIEIIFNTVEQKISQT